MLDLSNLMTFTIKRAAVTFVVSLVIIFSKISLGAEKNSLTFIDDIPVMDSMNIEPELSFSFDSPSGRVIILIATSSDDKELITQFYSQVMPQLGWEVVDNQYRRRDEKFQIISSDEQNNVIWRLSISPLRIK